MIAKYNYYELEDIFHKMEKICNRHHQLCSDCPFGCLDNCLLDGYSVGDLIDKIQENEKRILKWNTK